MEGEREQSITYPGTPKDRPLLKLLGGITVFVVFLFAAGLVTYPFFPAFKELKNPLTKALNNSLERTTFDLDVAINKELSSLGIAKEQIKVQIFQNVHGSEEEGTSYRYEIGLPSRYTFSEIQNRLYQAAQKAHGRLFEIYKGDPNEEVSILTLGVGHTITHTLRFLSPPQSPDSSPGAQRPLESNPSTEKPGFSGELRLPPRVAVVIDDIGFSEEPVRKLLHLGEPLTFAVIPYLEKSVAIARLLNEKNQEVILHIPMEPEETSFANLGRGGLWTYMDSEEIGQIVRESIAAVPYIKGVSNHMGSLFTRRSEKMQAVLNEVKKSGLFFLDSRTTTHTVGYQLARKMGLRTLERDIFLDDQDDLNFIKSQLKKVENLALREGKAIAIGHPRALTIEALRLVLPEFKKKNIEMVSVSQLIP